MNFLRKWETQKFCQKRNLKITKRHPPKKLLLRNAKSEHKTCALSKSDIGKLKYDDSEEIHLTFDSYWLCYQYYYDYFPIIILILQLITMDLEDTLGTHITDEERELIEAQVRQAAIVRAIISLCFAITSTFKIYCNYVDFCICHRQTLLGRVRKYIHNLDGILVDSVLLWLYWI